MRIAPKIELDAAVQRELTALARRGRVEARVQQRAKIVLLAAEGWQNKEIAVEVDLDRRQVALWRQRFLEGGVEALMHDAPRPGRTPSVTTAEFESSIVDKSSRAMDAPAGVGVFLSMALIVLGLVTAVLWICMPFAIFGTKTLLRELLAEQRKTNQLLAAAAERTSWDRDR